jgi:hypothetical protein
LLSLVLAAAILQNDQNRDYIAQSAAISSDWLLIFENITSIAEAVSQITHLQQLANPIRKNNGLRSKRLTGPFVVYSQQLETCLNLLVSCWGFLRFSCLAYRFCSRSSAPPSTPGQSWRLYT